MTVRNVRKNLAGQQDMLPGLGPYTQTRGGKSVVMDGVARSYIRLWKESIGSAYAGTFEDGCTLTTDQPIAVSLVTGEPYSYTGALPHDIIPNTDPTLFPELYTMRIDVLLRTILLSGNGMENIGYNPFLVDSETVSADQFLPKTSPLSYGAKFDGVHDDTIGINKAIKAKGANAYCVVQFPQASQSKMLGTVYIPSGVKIDLNGSTIIGDGTNVLFESGKWSGSNIVSSFDDAAETTLITDASVGNGLITECHIAVRVNNWIAGCRVHNMRGVHVNQLVHAKRCFYGEFYNLLAWDPLDGSLLPCFHWEGAVQAQGVKRCFAGSDYDIGHMLTGPSDMEAFDTCGGEGCGKALVLVGGVGGGTTGLRMRNWYFENNDTAIYADPAATYENVDIDNCFFNENFVLLDGPTILSGRFGRMNKIKTSVSKPGNINMLGNTAGQRGFTIELEDVTDSTNRIAPTIDTVGRFFVGPMVKISRDVNLTDLAGVPYARSKESPHLPVLNLTGQQFGTVPENIVPFCETFYAAPDLVVKTQFPYQDFAMFSYNINVVDTLGSFWVRGVVMGDEVFPLAAGQKTVTVTNNGGFAQLNISVFTGAATYRGVVKQL